MYNVWTQRERKREKERERGGFKLFRSVMCAVVLSGHYRSLYFSESTALRAVTARRTVCVALGGLWRWLRRITLKAPN